MAVVDSPLTMPSKKFERDSKAHIANAKAIEDFAQSIYTQLVPTGSMIMYAGATAPTGWLLCNGAAVSRTTYVQLFTVIGTTFGIGDGSTTFNLPNFQSASATTMRVPAGAGTGNALGTVNTAALSNGPTTQGGTIAVFFIIKSG